MYILYEVIDNLYQKSVHFFLIIVTIHSIWLIVTVYLIIVYNLYALSEYSKLLISLSGFSSMDTHSPKCADSSFIIIICIQVCLMLQLWDNMHDLFTVSSHTQRIYLPSCMSTVSTVHMQQHELWSYYFVDHTPRCKSTAAARTRHCNGDVLALLERRIYHQAMSKNRPRLSLHLRLGGLLSRPLETRGASRRSFENASLWPSTQHSNSD